MIIKTFENFKPRVEPKCKVCGSRMYITNRGGVCATYHCSSDAARFWDFMRGSKDQHDSKKHWDDSMIEICKKEMSKNETIVKSVFGKILELNSSNVDTYIEYYSKHLENFILRKSFLTETYQQIVDELVSIKKENNW